MLTDCVFRIVCLLEPGRPPVVLSWAGGRAVRGWRWVLLLAWMLECLLLVVPLLGRDVCGVLSTFPIAFIPYPLRCPPGGGCG